MTLSIKNGGCAFLIRLDLIFSVIMKGVPITANFKRPIYQTFKLILHENDIKLLKFKRSPV